MISCDLDTSIPDWIIEHPESLTVFQELSIDYSGGGKSLVYACRQRDLDAQGVLARVLRCVNDEGSPDDYVSLREASNGNSPCEAGGRDRRSPAWNGAGDLENQHAAEARTGEVVRLVMAAGKEITQHNTSSSRMPLLRTMASSAGVMFRKPIRPGTLNVRYPVTDFIRCLS